MNANNNSAHTSQSSEYDLSYHSQELESNIGKTGKTLFCTANRHFVY